jgi:hypothetical protein
VTIADTTGDMAGVGTLNITGVATVAAGSAAAPAIVSTTGTADTGIFFPAADTLAVSTAGAERMRIDSTGQIIQGTSTGAVNGSLQLRKNITGGTTSYSAGISATVQSDVTGQASGFSSFINTVASSFTLGILKHYNAQQGTIGAASAVTNQYGFFADSALTGATNNYGFYGNIASGTGRFNFYAAGTADNYFAGALGLGSVATTGSLPVNIGNSLTGATSVINVRVLPTILSDVTTSAVLFRTQPFTQAAAFTLGNLTHYDAVQGTIGATSAIANQYGFSVSSTLSGATNNFGFYSNIASGTGRFNFYANGTAANVFVGTTSIGGVVGAESLRVTPTASAVNYLQVAGSATGFTPVLSAQGSDSNISIEVNLKGTGRLYVSSDLEINSGVRVGRGAGNVDSNTVCGYLALASNSGGSYNTAIGRETLYSNVGAYYNTAIGHSSLFSNVSGFNNVAVGFESGFSLTGGRNVCIGYRAGRSITTGENNVCLGEFSGYDALVTLTTASNTVVLGNNDTTTLYCKTSTITTSDLRDKTNVRPVTLGLDFVNQINPIAYQFKVSREDDTPASRTYLGWAAQDVLANQGAENIVDQHDPENLKMAGMDMVAVLWKSVQELSAKVAELEAKLSAK